MKNYATIILALIAFDLYGQALGISRFLFEPVIRPLDYRPPQDYNASRGRGGHHGLDNRVTPNVHGNASPDAYGNNPVDFNSTYDRNALTYNMPYGQIYNGPNLPISSMAVGNPLNSLNERWHTTFDPDVVRQNLDRFTPSDNRYNPNLVLSGTLVESPWEFYASPQISMADPLNNLRHPGLESDPNYLTTQKSDGTFFINDHRLTTLNWDTLGYEEDYFALGGPAYDATMERIDAMEMGGYFQDGQAHGGSGDAWFSCPGLTPDHFPNTPAWIHHTWEKRHFSSLSRAGMDAKRSIPMDGIYAFIATGGPNSVHWFDRGGADIRESWHWGWAEGNGADKPIFNVGFAWVQGGPGGDPLFGGGGGLSGGAVVDLSTCGHYTVAAAGGGTFDGGVGVNERYGPGGALGGQTGNNADPITLATPYFGGANFTHVGTSSLESQGEELNGTVYNFVAENPTGTDRLAGHPAELSGSGLSPWDQRFGYDLTRFFGDFYIEPSIHTSNMNDSGDPAVNTGIAVDRRASRVTAFRDPIDPQNQISTRSMTDVMRMGDMRTKIRHINRFPHSGLDYLFQSGWTAPISGNRMPVYTQ